MERDAGQYDHFGRESQRSIDSHLADYVSKLQAGGRSEQYIAETAKYIRAIAESAGIRIAADVGPELVNRYANSLKEETKSARTIQAHVTAIKGFTKWLAENNKLPRDPLRSVRKPNPKMDRRRERRMLLPDEWRWLEHVTRSGPERFGMANYERRLLYRTAIETGLRSNELRSLRRGSLHLDASPPYITCKARSTKNQKDTRQYIQADLAEDLGEHVATKAPKSPLFKLPHESNVARMLRDDLADARSCWLGSAQGDPNEFLRRADSDFLMPANHNGQLFDFHSLRHTCGAWLAMTGVHPKTVQTVMRHSTITLTMDTYGHLFPGQEADAVGRLEGFTGSPLVRLAATGTEDPVPEARSASRSNGSANWCVDDAARCDERTKSEFASTEKKDQDFAARSEAVSSGTMWCNNSASLAQLAEQLTLNQ